MIITTPTPSPFGQHLAEFLGTVLLIFLGTGCVAALKVAGASFGLWETSVIWGVGVSMAAYLSAGVFGIHLNPAVSIALWLFTGFEGYKLPFYIIAQVADVFCAVVLVYTLYSSLSIEFEQAQNTVRGSQDSLAPASMFSTYPHPALSVGQAFLAEVVITAILMAVIMVLTDDGDGLPRGPLAPLLIGLLIAVVGSTMSPLTGFAMNPTCDFGPKLMTHLAGQGPIAFTGGREIPHLLVPIFAPILGACLGIGDHRVLIARHLPSAAAPVEVESEKVHAS